MNPRYYHFFIIHVVHPDYEHMDQAYSAADVQQQWDAIPAHCRADASIEIHESDREDDENHQRVTIPLAAFIGFLRGASTVPTQLSRAQLMNELPDAEAR